MKKLLLLMVLALAFTSCSTTTSFKVPKGAKLYVDEVEVDRAEQFRYTRNPFFWDKSSGIPYRLEKDGNVIDEGNVKAHFRVASIFWPPMAIIYWPMRFEPSYDFTAKDPKVRPSDKFKKVKHREE